MIVALKGRSDICMTSSLLIPGDGENFIDSSILRMEQVSLVELGQFKAHYATCRYSSWNF